MAETPVKGSVMSAPVDESVYTASGDNGSTYRYDSTPQQYIYNWKTGTGGNYYRIGVKLDDGQTFADDQLPCGRRNGRTHH